MPREEIPFDASHHRCAYPAFGRRFSELMEQTGKRPVEIALAIGVSPEIVRGYRRGFSHPSAQTKAKLENYFDMSLDYHENDKASKIIAIPSNIMFTQNEDGDFTVTFKISSSQLAKLNSA